MKEREAKDVLITRDSTGRKLVVIPQVIFKGSGIDCSLFN